MVYPDGPYCDWLHCYAVDIFIPGSEFLCCLLLSSYVYGFFAGYLCAEDGVFDWPSSVHPDFGVDVILADSEPFSGKWHVCPTLWLPQAFVSLGFVPLRTSILNCTLSR